MKTRNFLSLKIKAAPNFSSKPRISWRRNHGRGERCKKSKGVWDSQSLGPYLDLDKSTTRKVDWRAWRARIHLTSLAEVGLQPVMHRKVNVNYSGRHYDGKCMASLLPLLLRMWCCGCARSLSTWSFCLFFHRKERANWTMDHVNRIWWITREAA